MHIFISYAKIDTYNLAMQLNAKFDVLYQSEKSPAYILAEKNVSLFAGWYKYTYIKDETNSKTLEKNKYVNNR